MDTVAWPSTSETILGLTFFRSRSVAQVCRRSWKRTFATPVRSRSARQRRATRWRSKGSPTSEANTNPFSSSGTRPSSISRCWRSRCLLRASVAPPVSFTDRRLLLVLGAARTGPPLVVTSVRLTCSVPTSTFTSFHFRANSSPCLNPVCTARGLLTDTQGRAVESTRSLLARLLLRGLRGN